MEEIGVDGYKIASGEVSNIPMLERIAKTNKPVLLSSGMSTWAEIDLAMKTLRTGSSEIVVMQCSSKYPCPAESVGLNVIKELKERFPDFQVGFSDHFDGVAAGIAAAALGASCIEKHITFSRKMYGSDAALAMEPEEFSSYSSAIKDVWKMKLTTVDKNDVSAYSDMRHIFQKGIYLKATLRENHIIKLEDLCFKKPANGISAAEYKKILGKRLLIGTEADTPISLDMLSN